MTKRRAVCIDHRLQPDGRWTFRCREDPELWGEASTYADAFEEAERLARALASEPRTVHHQVIASVPFDAA
jgi:hypothetical protein